MKPIIIAIDGFSSCGKSTLAKALASALRYRYIDSGAMYRAVTYFFLENRVAQQQEAALHEALAQIRIDFREQAGETSIFLNGRPVEADIRQMAVADRVSEVAAISLVRRHMVRQQRELGRERSIVMDGRDIGTVVFPDAELKIFLTADFEVRVDRRYEELRRKGLPVDREEVRRNLAHRDHIDSTRDDSPLAKAVDAVVIDNTNLSEAEQLAMTLALAKERICRKHAPDAST